MAGSEAAWQLAEAGLDVSLVEINDYLNNGMCSAGPDRAKAALEKGVPGRNPRIVENELVRARIAPDLPAFAVAQDEVARRSPAGKERQFCGHRRSLPPA